MDLGGSPGSVCPSFAARGMSVTKLLMKWFLYLELLFLTHEFLLSKPLFVYFVNIDTAKLKSSIMGVS